MSARDSILALRRSHDELAALAEGLDAEALGTQSGSAEWSVAQVLSHLGSAAEIGLHTLTAGQADMAAAPAVWDRWNAMSPVEQAANYVTAERRLVEAFEALDDDALDAMVVDVGFLPAPVDVTFLTGMRLSEVGLHRWDIDVAFSPDAAVADYVVPFVLVSLPLFAGFFAKPIGQTGRIAVTTADPDRSYVLELGDAGATLAEGPGGDAETRVTLPAEAFLRLTSGRLQPGHTPSTVTVEGELSLDDLRRVFPGY